MRRFVKVNGREVEVVNAYSSGPGMPFNSYDLTGGNTIERLAAGWVLRYRDNFWLPVLVDFDPCGYDTAAPEVGPARRLDLSVERDLGGAYFQVWFLSAWEERDEGRVKPLGRVVMIERRAGDLVTPEAHGGTGYAFATFDMTTDEKIGLLDMAKDRISRYKKNVMENLYYEVENT